ncbi:stage III sporulation protein AA [Bacillus sp. FJAT-27264]|uniref:stage III sporulation protein AA n=1 Tax=Paenibacillus sp. (strain DSM 101736 / FJAT-27264) TaxID=1850362 RepID=UPI000807B29A|nr:stage III sporulation protein AA [Bacillus sp. FJAT-27264]OBZ18949.1 stage III sporulation protein AA [Bacillus sp. FJAT-27264]
MANDWLHLFPEKVRMLLKSLPLQLLSAVEEIRVREGRPLEINYSGKYHFLSADGSLTQKPEEAYRPDREDSHRLLDLISNHSLYTMEEELRKGFITIPGGHRIGLAGRTVLSGGGVEHLRDITGFNVRIAREVPGVADGVLPYLLDKGRLRVLHTLILSPPQHGKTTLLRDLARQISGGSQNRQGGSRQGLKVGIVDERSEIAGSRRGIPAFDVGPRTDILDGCPKAEGMMMMIRSLSPDVIIADEIGRPEDADAVTEALHAGITVVASAHGKEVAELSRRPGLGSLLEHRMFERYVILHRSEAGLSFRILDSQKRALLPGSPGERTGGERHA